jgi:hypothetical protein
MARVFRHPEVEDYFHSLDYLRPAEQVALRAGELYESGQMFVLENAEIDCDRSFLSAINLSNEAIFKKLKSISLVDRYINAPRSPAFDEIIRQHFNGDVGRFSYFTEQITTVNAQVAAMVKRLFPSYVVIRPSITWRMTETFNENLHVDVYDKDLPDHHIRMFVNLDIVPRIWHTSHTLETMLTRHLDLLDDVFLRSNTAGRICHALNFALFKGFRGERCDNIPKHIAFFDPGEIWVVDSRKVSHQIFYGRKALSTEYSVEASSMLDKSKHYYNIVERYREARLGLPIANAQSSERDRRRLR